jgi:hypothetical protein
MYCPFFSTKKRKWPNHFLKEGKLLWVITSYVGIGHACSIHVHIEKIFFKLKAYFKKTG